MIRPRRLLLAALFFLPLPAAAQLGLETLPRARVIVSPYFGARATHDTRVELGVNDGSEAFASLTEERRDGTQLVGGQVEVRVFGPLGVVAALAHSPASDIDFVRFDPGLPPDTSFGIGPELWLGKLGISYRLPEPSRDTRRFRTAGYISVAPAFVREDPRDNVGVQPEFREPITNFAVNVSGDASISLGTPRLALQLGIEDYITFWNGEAHARQFERFFERIGDPADVSADYDTSHIIVPRIGISLRF
ncbi:hypothetical protein BH20GEM2_BH20GEM2_18160 [soil metagenome]